MAVLEALTLRDWRIPNVACDHYSIDRGFQ
jgi:hypothetical protein